MGKRVTQVLPHTWEKANDDSASLSASHLEDIGRVLGDVDSANLFSCTEKISAGL